MSARLMLIGSMLALGSAFAFGTAAAQNVPAGRALAERSCSACHTLDSREAGGDAAPSFRRLAATNRDSPGWVRAWLSDPHPPMTGINLTRQEIDDIVAFLRTLPSAP